MTFDGNGVAALIYSAGGLVVSGSTGAKRCDRLNRSQPVNSGGITNVYVLDPA
ncbi:MAG: hypothetical protein ACRDKL_08645 [Solirubrobacteraceae bacterium]